MKKYLINGALALFAGAFVVGCAEKESDFVPLAEQKAMAFEEVFKEIYGEIDPYQDWGFSSGKIEIDPNDSSQVVEVVDLDANVGYTRAFPFGQDNSILAFNARTREGETETPVKSTAAGANTQHNLWGDPNYHDLNVPPALTDGQKLRVRRYFQTHPFLTYEDPQYTNFFVQQVYKGGTNTSGSLSTEVYPTANGGSVTGSNQMDKLTVGFPATGGEATDYYHHVNDFNNGDYNGGQTTLVLNTGASTNDFSSQSHPDQITYMISSKTDCVGYWSSNGSTGHNDRCALVSAAVIDAWADANNIGGDPCVDGWNRSFVGLDYDGVNGDNIYKKGVMVNGTWDSNAIAYAKISDARQKDYLWDGTRVWSFDDYIAAKGEYFLDKAGNKVPYTINERNMFIGTNSDLSGQSAYITKKYIPAFEREDDCIDLTVIQAKIDDACLPCDGKLYQWTKNVGGRDYIYSDWIVTLAPAGDAPEPSREYPIEKIDDWWMVEKGRVFCEDLGQATREDLDYNDVVFDAYIFKNHYKYTRWEKKKVNNVVVSNKIVEGPVEYTKYYANVEILAAGGTIPLTIQSNIDGSQSYQVHDMFVPKAGVATMINTRDNKSSAYGSFDVRDPVQIGGETKHFNAILPNGTKEHYDVKLFQINYPVDGKAIKEIKITSSFGTAKQIQEIESVRGEVPRKFMAPINTKWTSERKNISLAYPGFGTWVSKGTPTPWSNVNTNYTYNEPYNAQGLKLPLVMKAKSTIDTEGEQDLWHGSQKYQSSWSLAKLPLSLDLDQFYPGDRLRFYGTGIGEDAWITVVIGGIKPYFVDSQFPNYILDSAGNKTELTPDQSSCVEVLLDEAACNKLNTYVSGGKINFEVQGRNFTLTRICRVLFK